MYFNIVKMQLCEFHCVCHWCQVVAVHDAKASLQPTFSPRTHIFAYFFTHIQGESIYPGIPEQAVSPWSSGQLVLCVNNYITDIKFCFVGVSSAEEKKNNITGRFSSLESFDLSGESGSLSMGGKFFFNQNKVLGDVVDLVGQVKPYLRSVVVAREGGGIGKVDFLFLQEMCPSERQNQTIQLSRVIHSGKLY